MLYAVLCYNAENIVSAWTKEKDSAVMAHHTARLKQYAGRLGPVARLLPTTTATTVRAGREPLVVDGPFAETKEQLLGFYLFDGATLDAAIEFARSLLTDTGAYEIRPVHTFLPGGWKT